MFYPPRRTAQSLLLLAIAALGRDACQDGSCARPAQPLSLLQNKRVHLKAATASDDVEEQAAEDDSETPVVDEPTKTASLQQRWVRGKQHGAQSSPPAAETNATARHVEPAIGAKQDLSISPRPTVLPQHQQALTNSNVTLAPERLESLTPGATHEEAWRAGVGAPQGHWAEDQYPSSSSGRINETSSIRKSSGSSSSSNNNKSAHIFKAGEDHKDQSLFGVHVKRVPKVPEPSTWVDGEPSVETDEPLHAPRWWKTLGVGLTAAAIIACFMLLLLYLVELLVGMQAEYIRGLQADAKNNLKEHSGLQRKKTGSRSSSKGFASDEKITEQDISSAVNGLQNRLELLINIARSPDPRKQAQSLVERAAAANKLRLSQRGLDEIVNAVLPLATAVELRDSHLEHGKPAREKMRRQFKHVLATVHTQATLIRWCHDHDHSEMLVASQEEHAESLADKYSSGHKDSMHGTHADVKLAKSALGRYFASDRWLDHAAILCIFLYTHLCGAVYAIYLRYRFPLMYDFMGPWVLLSRAEAVVMVILTCIMILLMSRTFITNVRKIVGRSTVLMTIIDKNVLMHRFSAVLLVISACLHVLGHLKGSIPAIINEHNLNNINKAFTYGTKLKFNFNTWAGALQCWPAVTGFILVAVLVGFCCLSLETVRRKCFELFFYPHIILLVLWCTMITVHGAKQWLGCGLPIGLLSVMPVLAYYGIERMRDVLSGSHAHIVISQATIKKRTVHLEIDTGGTIQYETGNYCMLQVPAISETQWHPFTIASGGGDRNLQVLFAVVGDWTTAFKDLLVAAQRDKKPYPEIRVRGGYGAPATGMNKLKHIIMVGAGVGATPFLSFLSNICSAAQTDRKSQMDGVQSAVFYWVSREPEDFLWINKYHYIVESTPSLKGRVSIRLCLTKAMDTIDAKECSAAETAIFWAGADMALHKMHSAALSTEMGAPTNFGRPDWKKEFQNHSRDLVERLEDAGKDVPNHFEIGVFACGNAMLVNSLAHACDEVSDSAFHFRLHAEEF